MNEKFSAKEDETLIDLVRQHPPLYQVSSRSYKDAVIKNNIWKVIAGELGRSDKDCKARWKSMRDYYQRKKKEFLRATGTGPQRDDLFSKKFDHMRFLDNTPLMERGILSSSHQRTRTRSRDESLSKQHTDGIQQDEDAPEDIELYSTETADASPADSHHTVDTDYTNSFGSSSQEPSTKRRRTIKSCSSKDGTMLMLNELQKGRAELPKIPQTQKEDSYDPAISLLFKSMAATVSTFSPLLKARIKVDLMNLVSRYEMEHLSPPTDETSPLLHHSSPQHHQ